MPRSSNPRNAARPAAGLTAYRIDVTAEPLMLNSAAFKLNHAVALDNKAVLAGWCTAGLTLETFGLRTLATATAAGCELRFNAEIVGFLALVEVDPDTGWLSVNVVRGKDRRTATVDLERNPGALDLLLAQHGSALSCVLDVLTESPAWAALLLGAAVKLHPGSCKGNIESAGAVYGIGGLVVGWAIKTRDASLWLAAAEGPWRPLTTAIRYDRPDIHQALGHEYGRFAAEAGFLCALYGAWLPGSAVSLIAAGEHGLAVLSRKVWDPAPRSPLHYAKWAFSLPTPVGRSCRRLADHDGRLLTKLIEGSAPPPHPDCEETEFGARLRAPWVSIIVPLYGRADFMEHQLLEFASDADFQAAGVELIYVIDDPRLLDAVRERSQALFNLYRLPFRVLWGGMNRGYAGANNLGASKASAPHLIFLNSDAFPVEPGWARRLVDALVTRNDVAGVGARLLYPDGSVQHLGMKLEFDSYYGVWLNQHPGKGLMPASASPELLEVAAATGACLAVRKEDFEAVEGFDEGYLAGDFEDSDLCLKLTREGRKIVVVADTNIVHLERQSFEGIGSDAIRTNIVLFNAWRHTQRWRKELEGMPQ